MATKVFGYQIKKKVNEFQRNHLSLVNIIRHRFCLREFLANRVNSEIRESRFRIHGHQSEYGQLCLETVLYFHRVGFSCFKCDKGLV